MNHSARHDASAFAVVACVLVGGCALVTGEGGIFWVLVGVVPVSIVAHALDGR